MLVTETEALSWQLGRQTEPGPRPGAGQAGAASAVKSVGIGVALGKKSAHHRVSVKIARTNKRKTNHRQKGTNNYE